MSRKDTRLTGINPLAYIGVSSESSILVFSNNRAPTVNDGDFPLGTLWINELNNEEWILVSLVAGVATWIIIATPDVGILTFVADTGTAESFNNELDFTGDGNTVTTGAGNTITLSMNNGTDGQLYVARTGNQTALANITSTGGTVSVINAANSINLEDLGFSGIAFVQGDGGIATPVASNVNLVGGTNLNTVAAADVVTINLDNNVTLAGTLTVAAFGVGVMTTNATGVFSSSNGTDGQVLIGGGTDPTWKNITSPTGSITITNGPNTINIENLGAVGITAFATDAGTATAAANNINVFGGTNITTSAAGDTLTVALDNNVTLSGTLTLALLGAGVMTTNTSGEIYSSNGTNGQVLIGGGTDPTWANITSPFGSITITEGANTINIENAGTVGITAFATDSGTATAAANNINVYGGTNITTSAGGDTLTVTLDNNVTLSGTLTLSALGAGVMTTNAAGLITSSNGTDGRILIGGGTDPTWANITSTTLNITNAANSITIADGANYPLDSCFNVTDGSVFYASSYVQGDWFRLGPKGREYPGYFWPNDCDVLFNEGSPKVFTYRACGGGICLADTYFTAPVDGKYFFQLQINISGFFEIALVTKTFTRISGIRIVTTNRTYTNMYKQYGELTASDQHDEDTICMDVVTDMAQGDEARFYSNIEYINVTPAPATLLTASPSNDDYPWAWISGYVIV